jgi:hypothetical protein
LGLVQGKLAFSGKTIPYLPPVYEVPAVEYGDAGKIDKRACDEIIIFSDAAYAWVRIEAWDDRITVFHRYIPNSHIIPLKYKKQRKFDRREIKKADKAIGIWQTFI